MDLTNNNKRIELKTNNLSNRFFMSKMHRAHLRNEDLLKELKEVKKIANHKTKVVSTQDFTTHKVNYFDLNIFFFVLKF